MLESLQAVIPKQQDGHAHDVWMQGIRVLQPSRSAQKHAQPTCIFATMVSSRRLC